MTAPLEAGPAGRRAIPVRALLYVAASALALFVILSVVGLARLMPRVRGLERRGEDLTAVSLAMRSVDSSLSSAADALVAAARDARRAGPLATDRRLERVRVRLRALFDSTFIAQGRVFGPISDSARVALARATLAESDAVFRLQDGEVWLTLGAASRALASVAQARASQRAAREHLDALAHDIVADLVEREIGYNHASDRALRFMFWWGLVGLALVGAVTVIAYVRLYEPIAELQRGLGELAAGNYRARLPIRRADETGRLMAAVNRVAESLEARASAESQQTWSLGARLEQVLEAGSDEIWVFDAGTWRIQAANRAARTNLGYAAARLGEMTPLDLLADFTREQLASVLDAVRHGERPQAFLAATLRRANGTSYPVELTLRFSEAERPPVFLAAARDVSERTRIEAERDLVFHQSADLMAIASAGSGRLLRVNPAMAAILGLPDDEIAGRPILDFVHPDDRETIRRQLERLAAHEPVREGAVRLRGADGDYRWVSWNIDPPRGGTLYAIGRDITERRLAESRQEELQTAVARSAREWRMTFDTLDDPVVILSEAGQIVRLNEAARRLAGHPHTDLLGRGLEALEPADLWASAATLVAEVRRERAPASGQVQSGRERHTWDLRAHPVSGAAAGQIAVVIVAHDVTSVVRLQDAARRNEAMAAMGALVAGVAHEVRNPLFSMSATLDALEARQGAGAGGRHMEILHGQLDRLQQLMGELLDYGRPPALATADVGFDAVARQAVDEGAALARERGVELVAEVPAGLPRIRADQARLAQVYVNLITNAIHYSPQGARVVVRARLAGENGSQWLETVVEDAGRGFPAEDLPRIFEPFFSRRPGGTGLGLALVQRIVEQHGGSVTAGNRPEGGAAVVVRLPLAGAQVAQG